MSVELAWPWALAILPLPLLVALLGPRADAAPSAALRIPFYAALQANVPGATPQHSRTRWVLGALAWVFLVLAATRPQFVGEPIQMPVSGRNLMLAVDISGSMETADMVIGGHRVSRLSAVKAVAGDFIERREGDRLGLILFGRQAYLQTPLTFDRETVRTLLEEAAIGLAGKETAIGDAIGLAVKRLRERPQEHRVLILLTDGANTAGTVNPLKAADLAAQEGVRIYTIGVGADSIAVRGLFGMRRVRSSDLDEKTLSSIAQKTAGRYFRARDVGALEEIYALLDELEPLSDEETFRPVDELYGWPLALALLTSVFLALGLSGLHHRWRPGEA
jgi:Ca-activated chloride channel family protein